MLGGGSRKSANPHLCKASSLLYPTASAARIAAISGSPPWQPFHHRQSSTINGSGLVRGGRQKRFTSKCLGVRQLALSCDPIVLFEGVPDLVLTFTILCSGQSFYDQVRSWYHVERRPHLGVKIHTGQS